MGVILELWPGYRGVAAVLEEGVWSGLIGELSIPEVVVDETIGCEGVLNDEAVYSFVVAVGEVVDSSTSMPKPSSSFSSSAGSPAASLSALLAALSLSLFRPGNFSGLLGPYLASCCKNIDLPSSTPSSILMSMSTSSPSLAVLVVLERKAGSG